MPHCPWRSLVTASGVLETTVVEPGLLGSGCITRTICRARNRSCSGVSFCSPCFGKMWSAGLSGVDEQPATNPMNNTLVAYLEYLLERNIGPHLSSPLIAFHCASPLAVARRLRATLNRAISDKRNNAGPASRPPTFEVDVEQPAPPVPCGG